MTTKVRLKIEKTDITAKANQTTFLRQMDLVYCINPLQLHEINRWTQNVQAKASTNINSKAESQINLKQDILSVQIIFSNQKCVHFLNQLHDYCHFSIFCVRIVSSAPLRLSTS